jgi:hypothetical protein
MNNPGSIEHADHWEFAVCLRRGNYWRDENAKGKRDDESDRFEPYETPSEATREVLDAV